MCVLGGGLTSDSNLGGGGAENTFSQQLFIISKKVWGLKHPQSLPLCRPSENMRQGSGGFEILLVDIGQPNR